MSETTPSLVGQVISGCEILQKTAEGGMGSVYRARHKALNRQVCIKILSPSLAKDKKAVELFLTEARAIAELDHPNIVNVYDVGKENGYYFIVMSFIEGQTLSSLLKKQKILPISQVLDLFDGVLQGLAAAHAKGIIHRDIKPSNILINPQGQPKLVDFGIAKKVDKDTGSTKTTELAGTAYFIAPEQALGRRLDIRADLYSIGASMYYVLTGQFPYNGKNTVEIIQKHINEPVPNPAKLRKEMPPWLALAIQKLMNKNPDDRFQTAKEVCDHFRKMRAEDQLRFKSGATGKAVDLGNEGSLKVKEEKHGTTTLRTPRFNRTPSASFTNPADHPTSRSLMPQIKIDETLSNIDLPKGRTNAGTTDTLSARMLNATDVKPVDVFIPVRKKPRRGRGRMAALAGSGLKKLLNFMLLVPLFALFSAVVVYMFYTLGTVCAPAAAAASGGIIHQIVSPFLAPAYGSNQLLLMGLGVVMVALIFASSIVKAFSRSTTVLLFLAFVSFLSGLFTPDVPFMQLTEVSRFIFSPEYYFCYLVVAVTWCISLCWRLNRSVAQGVFGAVLVIFAMSMSFLSAHVSIPPCNQDMFFMVLFYSSLFCGIVSTYYLISRNYKDTILMPCVLFLLAVAGIWTYTLSGVVVSVNTTMEVVIPRVEVSKSLSAKRRQQLEESLNSQDTREVFKGLDKSNELTGMTEDEAFEVLAPRVEKAFPKVFNEEVKPLFVRFLTNYHQGGRQRMKAAIWEYALAIPIYNFNRLAQTNNAYFFMITILFMLGVVNCIGMVLFGDEL